MSILLIGVQYKIVAKILAIRLAKVVDGLVSDVQFNFAKGRQFFHGPLMIVARYKKNK